MSVRLREVRDDELQAWKEASFRFYVDDLVESGGMTRADAEKKARRDQVQTLAEDGNHLFVIEDGAGRAVGRLWFARKRFGVWLYEIELDPAVRGRGLGRAAMLAFEEKARELGATKVMLNVFGGNDAARSLYRSLGYAEESVHMGKRL